nr:MAG TPA: hypothetical protein [Caudoviricetes sp.]
MDYKLPMSQYLFRLFVQYMYKGHSSLLDPSFDSRIYFPFLSQK